MNNIEKFDMVVGVRTIRRDPMHRLILGWLHNWAICLLYNIKFRDITCGFKLIKKSVLDAIELKSKSGFINAELMIKTIKIGYKIKEVPVKHFPRIRGKQSGARLKTFIDKIYEMFKLWREESV